MIFLSVTSISMILLLDYLMLPAQSRNILKVLVFVWLADSFLQIYFGLNQESWPLPLAGLVSFLFAREILISRSRHMAIENQFVQIIREDALEAGRKIK